MILASLPKATDISFDVAWDSLIYRPASVRGRAADTGDCAGTEMWWRLPDERSVAKEP